VKYTCQHIIEQSGDVAAVCDAEFIATDESLPANASMEFNESTGAYEYTGNTDVCWDGQTTNVGPNDRVLVLCESGHITESPEGFGVA
jgi:hypothetical protein